MLFRSIGVAAAVLLLSVTAGAAQQPLKIGLVVSLTGAFNVVGQAAANGVQLYIKQHGDVVAGRKIQLIIRDDGTSPEAAKRLTQELIVRDKVEILGAGVTPMALSMASLATEAKIPTVIMISGASVAVERSPYMVRTSFTLGQSSAVMADWAVQNGAKKVVTLVNDWAPGLESEGAFKDRLAKDGLQVLESMRVPLANPDFAPFLQRARDRNPDTIFVYVPDNQAGIFAKQFMERGMDKSGIRLIGTGDITDDNILPGVNDDSMLGITTTHHYSAAHDSALNKAYVKDFEVAYGKRPNFISVGGYDGMHLIYETLKKTGGRAGGDVMMAAMKGMAWESPRGPMSIDPETRDVVHNEYVRKVERVNGQLYNIETATIGAVKDPLHGKK